MVDIIQARCKEGLSKGGPGDRNVKPTQQVCQRQLVMRRRDRFQDPLVLFPLPPTLGRSRLQAALCEVVYN